MTRHLRALPWAEWPAADRQAWDTAFAEGDVFDGRGPGHHLRTHSRASLLMAYRSWLGHLRDVEPACLQATPASRVTVPRIRRYVESLAARNLSSSTIWNAVKHLYDAMRLLAPEQDWRWLKTVKARLEAQVVPRQKAHRLVDAAALFDLGLALMDETATVMEQDSLGQAIRYRTGLIIALLASRPLRRRTLAALRIGKHLVRHGELWMLVIPAQDSKTRRPEEWEVPTSLLPYLEHYLTSIRPFFRGSDQHDWLWASDKGGGLKGGRARRSR